MKNTINYNKEYNTRYVAQYDLAAESVEWRRSQCGADDIFNNTLMNMNVQDVFMLSWMGCGSLTVSWEIRNEIHYTYHVSWDTSMICFLVRQRSEVGVLMWWQICIVDKVQWQTYRKSISSQYTARIQCRCTRRNVYVCIMDTIYIVNWSVVRWTVGAQ